MDRLNPHEVIVRVYIALLTVLILCNAGDLEKELTLTSKQKLILDKFRDEISNTIPQDYMKEDIYLIKWLRANQFNMEETKLSFERNLKWREENRMDDILNEEFPFFDQEFPFWLDGKDYSNRPVGSADISAWDPRPVVLSGQEDQLFRFMVKTTEFAYNIIRDQQKAGQNVTQLTLVANLKGFNLIQHGCLRCIPLYIKYLLSFQNYYPGLVHKLYLVNTPAAFDVLLRIIYPVLNQETRDFLSIHGTNKNAWRKIVLSTIPPDQIRSQFGGFKPQE